MTRLFAALDRLDPDPNAEAIAAAQADERPGVLDLTGNAWRDETGATPVPETVKAAEERLVARQQTKADQPPGGDPAFHTALTRLVLGDEPAFERLAAVSAGGGTGALRLALEAVARLNSGASVWIGDPAHPRHGALVAASGLAARRYRYVETGTGDVAGDAMLADLRHAKPGDIVLLQGCCHAPTGRDLTPDLWAALAALLLDRGAVPLIDLGYAGLGQGLARDCDGTQGLMMALPEALLAVSCSHSFGTHGDRAGLLLVQAEETGPAALAQEMLERILTVMTDTPSDHGPRVVTEILDSPDLRDQWLGELKTMRMRLGEIRAGLAELLTEATKQERWSGLGSGTGLFTQLPLGAEQRRELRDIHAVHLGPEGRANLAALPMAEIPRVAAAVADVLGSG